VKIRIKLLGQARAAAGIDCDTLECEHAPSIADVLHALAAKHGPALQRLLLDEHGAPQASVMLFVNDEQVVGGTASILSDDDDVTIMPPISGG